MSNDNLKTAEMLKSGIHFGYSRSTRHPKMKPYLFATRNNVEIFDLEKIYSYFQSAKNFLKEAGKEGKKIIFVGTKKGIGDIIEEAGISLNMPYVNERWLGGTLTNFKEIKSRVDFLKELIEKKERGELDKYTKKERLEIDRKIIKLEKYLKGLKNINEKPSVMIVVDSNYEKNAIREARQERLKIIALMNSDCNPEDADYPVPGNDSAISSVKFFIKEMVDAYKEGLLSVNNKNN